MNEERKIVSIPINKIIPNIYQPRIIFDDKSLNELSNSIKRYGIIQPLVLRHLEDKYEIVDGERRYKAAKRIGLETVPAIVLEINDKELAELILNENIQKQLLNPIEEANAYEQIMLLNRCNIDELSNIIGKEKTIIEAKLNLLKLPPEIQEALLNNKISESHARILTKLNNKQEQLNLYNRIIKERLTIKDLEKIINNNQDEIELQDKNTIKKEKRVIDKFSLEDLNKKDFIEKQKEEKVEEKNMNNQDTNISQYNGLLKEQEKPQMGNATIPEPILGNTVVNQKPNDFFPSLEDQPLNTEVPINNISGAMPMTPPPIDMSTSQNMPSPVEMPQMNTEPTPPVATEIPQFGPAPAPTPVEMPQMNAKPTIPVAPEMPQFGPVPAPAPVEMPQINTEPTIPTAPEMPQFGPVPAPTPVEMPQINTAPTIPVAPEMQQFGPVPAPTPVEMPQMNDKPTIPVAPEIPQFGPVPAPTPVEMPQVNAEPTIPVAPEMPQAFPEPNGIPQFGPNPTPNETVVSQPQTNNTVLATTILKDILPLLEHSGYKIILEESDTPTEHLVTFKIQK